MQGFQHPFFDRRNEIPWNGAPHDMVDELKPLSTGKRVELKPTIAELSMSAGLLLVFPLGLRRAPNGLFVGDFRSMNDDFSAILALKLFKCHIHVQLSHPAEDHLLR